MILTNLSMEYLDRCAGETGFLPESLEKVIRIGEMAADIARHPFLGDILLLKGGTALNLCFGAPSRLSVDLDYNYIGAVDRDKMMNERPALETAVIELAKRRGYLVQVSADTFAGRKIYLTYRSGFGHDDRIEVDLNFLFRVPLGEVQEMKLWQPGEFDQPQLRVVSTEELLTGKIIALLGRSAPRDVWDIANLSETATRVIDSPLFRAVFYALAVTLEHPLYTYDKKHLSRVLSGSTIAHQLTPMLLINTEIIIEELIEKAWNTISHLITPTKSESNFISLVEQGQLRPELLFTGNTELERRIASHPALLWKISNVRAHLNRPGTKH